MLGMWQMSHKQYLLITLMSQMLKNLPAMQETLAWSLGWQDPLGKGMATLSSILALRIPWTEEPGGLQSRGLQRDGHDERLTLNILFPNITWEHKWRVWSWTSSEYVTILCCLSDVNCQLKCARWQLLQCSSKLGMLCVICPAIYL